MFHQDTVSTNNNLEAFKERGKKNPSSSLGPKSNPSLNSCLSCDVKLFLVPRVAQKHLQKKKKHGFKPRSNFEPKLHIGFIMHHQAIIGTKSNSKALVKIKLELKLEFDFEPKLEFRFIMHCWVTLGTKTRSEALLGKKNLKNQKKYEAQVQIQFQTWAWTQVCHALPKYFRHWKYFQSIRKKKTPQNKKKPWTQVWVWFQTWVQAWVCHASLNYSWRQQ